MNDTKCAGLAADLRSLRLLKAAEVLEEQFANEPEYVNMSFAERLSRILDAERCSRTDSRTERLAKKAGFAIPHARLEDLKQHPERHFDQHLVNSLQTNNYICQGHNVIISGAAGSGKSFLSCALGTNACRAGYKVRYYTASDLSAAAADARGQSASENFFKDIYRTDLLIVDEFLLFEPAEPDLRDLFRILHERYTKKSTIVCSPFLSSAWYDRLGGGAVAESILDRLVNSSFTLTLTGDQSMRQIYENVQVCSRASSKPDVGAPAL